MVTVIDYQDLSCLPKKLILKRAHCSTAAYITRTSIPTSPKKHDWYSNGTVLCDMVGTVLRISQVC